MTKPDDIYDRAQHLLTDDDPAVLGLLKRLFEEASQLDDNNHLKLPLLQSLAHSAFMRAGAQLDDWEPIDELFRIHCSVGFSRLHSKMATFVVYAECSAEFAGKDEARLAILLLTELVEESREDLGIEQYRRRKAHIAELEGLVIERFKNM